MIDRRAAALPPAVPLARLWFGVAAAPGAWVLALLLGYLTSSSVCRSHGSAPQAVVRVLAAMLVIALAGLIVAFTNWRKLARGEPARLAVPDRRARAPWWGRSRFLAGGGLFTSAVFLVGIVFFAIPAFLVPACGHI